MCANMNKLALCISTQAGPFIDIPLYFGGKMLCFGVRTRFEKKHFFDRQEFRKKKNTSITPRWSIFPSYSLFGSTHYLVSCISSLVNHVHKTMFEQQLFTTNV